MSIEAKTKHLFEILKRIDSYILSTNAKCAAILSYCAAAITAVSVVEYNMIPKVEYGDHRYWIGLLGVIVFLSTVFCIWLAIKVIFPLTFSSVERNNGESVVFFGDIVSTSGGASAYSDKYKKLSEDELLEDLAKQVFTVSKIANVKFAKIKFLILVLVSGNIIPFLVLLVYSIILMVFGIKL